jgi:CHAD domain-containing protein
MAKARRVPGLNGEVSFADAARRTVQIRSQEVFDHADGVLDTSDIERVHAMRVATRRLRAALEIFAPCFPKKEHNLVLDEVNSLADALGERRDPDVQIASLEALRDALGQGERTGVNGLVAEIRGRQRQGNELLEAELERIRELDLAKRLQALAASAADT